MKKNERIKQVLTLLLAGNNRAKIAAAMQISEQEVARWMAHPEFLHSARAALTDRILALIPKTLEKLEDLLDSDSDTQAMNAIKVVIKQLENAEDYDVELEKLRKALEPVVATILDIQEQNEIAEAELKRNEGENDEGNIEEAAPQE